MLAEYIEGGFESVYHGDYLFFRDRKLGYFQTADIAPSRRFAAYLDVHSERPYLFRVADETSVKLSDEPVSDFGGFEWDETNKKVTLRYATARPPQNLPFK